MTDLLLLFREIDRLESDPENKDPIFGKPSSSDSLPDIIRNAVESLDSQNTPKVHIKIDSSNGSSVFKNIDINRFTLYRDMILGINESEFTFTLEQFYSEFKLLVKTPDVSTLCDNFIQDPERWYQVLSYFRLPLSDIRTFYKILFDDILEKERLSVQKFFEDNLNQISDYQSLAANPNLKDDFFERHPEVAIWGNCDDPNSFGIETNPSVSEKFLIKHCRTRKRLEKLLDYLYYTNNEYKSGWYGRKISFDFFKSILKILPPPDNLTECYQHMADIQPDDNFTLDLLPIKPDVNQLLYFLKNNFPDGPEIKIMYKYLNMSLEQWDKFFDKYLHTFNIRHFLHLIKYKGSKELETVNNSDTKADDSDTKESPNTFPQWEHVINLLLEKAKKDKIQYLIGHDVKIQDKFITGCQYSPEFIMNHHSDTIAMYFDFDYNISQPFYFNIQTVLGLDPVFVQEYLSSGVMKSLKRNEYKKIETCCSILLEDFGRLEFNNLNIKRSPQISIKQLNSIIEQEQIDEGDSQINFEYNIDYQTKKHFLFTPGATKHFFLHPKSRREKFTFDKDFQRIIKEEQWYERR